MERLIEKRLCAGCRIPTPVRLGLAPASIALGIKTSREAHPVPIQPWNMSESDRVPIAGLSLILHPTLVLSAVPMGVTGRPAFGPSPQ